MNLKRLFLPIILLSLVGAACGLPGVLVPTETPTSKPEPSATEWIIKPYCEDDLCEMPEESESDSQSGEPVLTPKPPQNKPGGSMPLDETLYLGVMVHLEGWEDEQNQQKFERHAAIVREVADLFERYDARLTFESKEFTAGSLRWGDNVLLEMEQRGHGIGVHADLGGQRSTNCPQMTADLRRMKDELESLGVTVRRVSGIVSHCDWVAAAADAGYEFTSGTVKYALMSLPKDKWPEGFEGCPNPAACHQPYPPDLADRLSPWRVDSGRNWLQPAPGGRLVLLPSGGGMVCMAEEAASDESFTSCTFDLQDVDAFQQELDSALTLVDGRRINTYYLGWSIGQAQDPELLEALLQRVEPYVQSGQVQWATLPEMYDLFLVWEEARGH